MNQMKGQFGTANITIPLDQVEETCQQQIQVFLDHPAFTQQIAIMPDTHAGKGAVIGFTMPLGDRVIPNVIGVDIGCGMHSFSFGRDMGVSHEHVDAFVRAHVPFGFNVHERPAIDTARDFPWEAVTRQARSFAARFSAQRGLKMTAPRYCMDWFLAKCRQIGMDSGRTIRSLGSLGGGNHFIEIGRSTTSEDLWVTIHTGSRGFGLKIANYWQSIATRNRTTGLRDILRTETARIKAETKNRRDIQGKIAEVRTRLGLDKNGNPSGLEWLEDEDMAGYLFDMIFAQAYAEENRRVIASVLCRALGVEIGDEVHSVHNFISPEDFIIRKGAISSYDDERMIIPFNMRDGVLICEGRSNADWNFSAPHGAGRVMSRSKARKKLSVEEFAGQMDGIFSTSVGSATIDEAPNAYKDAKMIEDAIEPTAVIVDRLIPIHNLKSDDPGRPRRRKKH